jgi:hypothetical protein
MLTNTARCSGDVITSASRKHPCPWWRYAAALLPPPRKAQNARTGVWFPSKLKNLRSGTRHTVRGCTLRWPMTEANRRMPQHYSPNLTQRLSDLLASLGSSDDVAPIDITTFGRKTAEIIAGGCMNQRTSNVAVPKFKRTRRVAGPSSPPSPKSPVESTRTADGHRADLLALARIRFCGPRYAL